MSFSPGDKVIIEGQYAEIVQYNEEANLVIFVTTPHGGGSDTRTAHINNTRIDPVPTATNPAPVDYVVVEEPAPVEKS